MALDAELRAELFVLRHMLRSAWKEILAADHNPIEKWKDLGDRHLAAIEQTVLVGSHDEAFRHAVHRRLDGFWDDVGTVLGVEPPKG